MTPEYRWTLAELKKHSPNAPRVFGTFICCGGSSMGYKLAGMNHLGGIEIDERMASVYRRNLNPEVLICDDIRNFKNHSIPKDIDILDGSPPCSLFSAAGIGQDGFGVEKKFAEGQAKQILDDLFFKFIDLAEHIGPRVIVAENVKGMLMKRSQPYVLSVIARLKDIGYTTQVFLLDASKMGVPQKRERVFFIAQKTKDFKEISLNFNDRIVTYGEIRSLSGIRAANSCLARMRNMRSGDCSVGVTEKRIGKKGSFFSNVPSFPEKVMPTITTKDCLFDYATGDRVSDKTKILSQTFPLDYDFSGIDLNFALGMSVPPLMMKKIALAIQQQIF